MSKRKKPEKLGERERTVALRVTEARSAVGMTKRELADRLGLEESSYSPYENFGIAFNIDMLDRLSRIFNRPVEWFLGLPTELTADEQQVLALYRRAKDLQRGVVALAVLEGVIAE